MMYRVHARQSIHSDRHPDTPSENEYPHTLKAMYNLGIGKTAFMIYYFHRADTAKCFDPAAMQALWHLSIEQSA